jgi:hypothetical protein
MDQHVRLPLEAVAWNFMLPASPLSGGDKAG